MKKVVLILVLFLVVAGGAGAAAYFMGLGPFQKEEINPEDIDEPLEVTTEIIKVSPFTIPLFQGERIAGSIQVQFELEVTLGQEQVVNDQMRRLEDAYLRDLYVFLPRLLRNQENLDIVRLKRRLMRITEKIVGPDVVEDILIQSVADNPG